MGAVSCTVDAEGSNKVESGTVQARYEGYFLGYWPGHYGSSQKGAFLSTLWKSPIESSIILQHERTGVIIVH